MKDIDKAKTNVNKLKTYGYTSTFICFLPCSTWEEESTGSAVIFLPLFYPTSWFLALKEPPPQLTRYDTSQWARSSPRVRLLRPIRGRESLPSVQSQFFLLFFFFFITDCQTKPSKSSTAWERKACVTALQKQRRMVIHYHLIIQSLIYVTTIESFCFYAPDSLKPVYFTA